MDSLNLTIEKEAMKLYDLLPTNRRFKLADAFGISSKNKMGLSYETTKNRLNFLKQKGLILILSKGKYLKSVAIDNNTIDCIAQSELLELTDDQLISLLKARSGNGFRYEIFLVQTKEERTQL